MFKKKIAFFLIGFLFTTAAFAADPAPAKPAAAPAAPAKPAAAPKPGIAPGAPGAAPLLTAPQLSAFAVEDAFVPGKLEKLTKDLFRELSQLPKNSKSYAIVVNGLSPFWTPAAIGGLVAANELQVTATFHAPSGNTGSNFEMQKNYLQLLMDDKFQGVAVASADGDKIPPLLKKAMLAGMNVVTIDSDLPKDTRKFYIGSDNFNAGVEAGKSMLGALGPKGGKIVIAVGSNTTPNAIERIRGINSALKGTPVTVVATLIDGASQDNAQKNVLNAFQTTPDLAGIIGVYSYNGPAALRGLKQINRRGKVKVVAFDLEDETLKGLKGGEVAAAIVQRPYYWGRLSVYVLHALKALSPGDAVRIITPYLEGPDHDMLDTKVDVVTPQNLNQYLKHLNSLVGSK